MTKGRPPAPANASQPRMPWLNHYPKGVDWHMPLSVAPLYRLLDDAVAAYPEPPLHDLPRQDTHLSRDRREGRPRHARAAAARRAQRHQSRSVPAELADLHRLLLCRDEGRRDGRQLQPPLHRRRADPAGEGQRHRADGDARLAGAVRQGGGAARCRVPEARRRCLLPGTSAGDQGRSVPAVQVEGPGAAAGFGGPREDHPRSRGDGGRRSRREGQDRSADRCCGAAVHRRDDGHAQGRHAHACQLLREYAAGGGVEPRPRERHRAGVRCPAVLPRLRADGGDECRHQPGGAYRHHAALLARRSAEADRPREADDHAVRSDAAQRHHEPPAHQELRSLVAEVLPVGRRRPSPGGEAADSRRSPAARSSRAMGCRRRPPSSPAIPSMVR